MRKINIYLHLLMFIGVGVTLLHFFSTPVHADGPVNLNTEYVVTTLDQNNVSHNIYLKFYTDGYVQAGTTDARYFVSVSCPDNIIGRFVLNLNNGSNTMEISYSQGNQNVYVGGQSPMTNSAGNPYTYAYKCVNQDSINFINVGNNIKGSTTDFNSYSSLSPQWYTKGTKFNLGGPIYNSVMPRPLQNLLYRIYIPSTYYAITSKNIHAYLRSWYSGTLGRSWDLELWQPINTNTGSGAYYYFFLPDNIQEDQVTNLCDLIIEYNIDVYYSGKAPYKLDYISPNDKDYYTLLDIYYQQIQSNYIPQESTDVDNSNSGFSSASNQMIQLEDQLQGDFNSAIGNITVPTNPFNDMGVMFGNSSRFLVHMFDQMTISNGSPFGTVITFSLILGLALLMIGKKGSK